MAKNKKYIGALVTVIGLVVLMFVSSGSGLTRGARNLVGLVLSPIDTSVSFVYVKFNQAADFLFGSKELRQEYKILQVENSKLKEDLAISQEIISREDFLRAEYELMKKVDYSYIQAYVKTENPDSIFGTFIIDKGEKDGVKVGDIVISGVKYTDVVYKEGLVGLVEEVGTNWARVNSTLAEDSSISFINTRTLDKGVLNSHGKDGLRGYNFNSEADTKPGDKLLTSGLGGTYPKGIYIGEVKAVNESHDFESKLIVESKVDLDKLYRVLIIDKDALVDE